MITASQSLRGDPRDELPAPVAGEVLTGGGQDPGLRVDLQPLSRFCAPVLLFSAC